MSKPLWDRLWEKVEEQGDCWVFTGYNHRGHGQIYAWGRTRYAHRVAYRLLVGQIPPRMVIDHTCPNKACVNPRHLDAVTQAENLRRIKLRPRRKVVDTGLGTGKPGPEPRSQWERFWPKVDATGDCWEWTASRLSNGYGQFWRGTRDLSQYAHRAVWEMLVGEVPEGYVVDHMCLNKGCVNPDHLRLLTWRENIDLGHNPRAEPWSHCKQGHAMTDDNVYEYEGGGRRCRTCAIEKSKERWRRQVASRA